VERTGDSILSPVGYILIEGKEGKPRPISMDQAVGSKREARIAKTNGLVSRPEPPQRESLKTSSREPPLPGRTEKKRRHTQEFGYGETVQIQAQQHVEIRIAVKFDPRGGNKTNMVYI